jgi:hypothetical protein
MSKTGYFVVTHNIEEVDIAFIEQNDENEELFTKLCDTDGVEEVGEIWFSYLQKMEDDDVEIESWFMGDEWPFDGYEILGAVNVPLI